MASPDQWHREETYKGLIALGQGALKIAAVINGGAAVAFLAFIGKFYNGEIGTSVNLYWALRVPMIMFISGLTAVGIASATAYLMQLVLFNEEMGRSHQVPRWQRGHQRWLTLTVLLVIGSYLLFAIGAVMATVNLT
jgi:hypothetical protein